MMSDETIHNWCTQVLISYTYLILLVLNLVYISLSLSQTLTCVWHVPPISPPSERCAFLRTAWGARARQLACADALRDWQARLGSNGCSWSLKAAFTADGRSPYAFQASLPAATSRLVVHISGLTVSVLVCFPGSPKMHRYWAAATSHLCYAIAIY